MNYKSWIQASRNKGEEIYEKLSVSEHYLCLQNRDKNQNLLN